MRPLQITKYARLHEMQLFFCAKGRKKSSVHTGQRCCTAYVSISSGQRYLMKTYHNDANTKGITKIALKRFLDFF